MTALLELRRLFWPLVVLAMVGGAIFTYQAKQQAIDAADHVSQLRADIQEERVSLSLLKAEWGELTQPGRIQDLVARYPTVLSLAPFDVNRMVQITDIPFAPNHDFIADVVADAGNPTVGP